jgi:hypothetical protein
MTSPTTRSNLLIACFVGGVLCLTGCKGGRSTQEGGQQPDAKSVQGDQAQSDLGFLGFAFSQPVYGKDPEGLPASLEAAANAIKAIDERIYERVKQGLYVIKWGAPMNAPVLAYEKDAPSKGGWVLPGNGPVRKMTADELQKLLAKKAG